jgi:hypothetical protein
MGSGAFGSNGSVLWEIKYSDKPTAAPAHRDFDAAKRHPGDHRKDLPASGKSRPMIGAGKTHSHPEKFRVTARYPNKASALHALETAVRRLKRGKVVVLDVDLLAFHAAGRRPGSLGGQGRLVGPQHHLKGTSVTVDW